MNNTNLITDITDSLLQKCRGVVKESHCSSKIYDLAKEDFLEDRLFPSLIYKVTRQMPAEAEFGVAYYKYFGKNGSVSKCVVKTLSGSSAEKELESRLRGLFKQANFDLDGLLDEFAQFSGDNRDKIFIQDSYNLAIDVATKALHDGLLDRAAMGSDKWISAYKNYEEAVKKSKSKEEMAKWETRVSQLFDIGLNDFESPDGNISFSASLAIFQILLSDYLSPDQRKKYLDRFLTSLNAKLGLEGEIDSSITQILESIYKDFLPVDVKVLIGATYPTAPAREMRKPFGRDE